MPPVDPAKSLLSILTSGEPPTHPLVGPAVDSLDKPLLSSRMFPKPIAQLHASQATAVTPSNQFNPPQGSRLLALGNLATANKTPIGNQTSYPQSTNGMPLSPSQLPKPTTAQPGFYTNSSSIPPTSINTYTSKETFRPPPGFSPFEEQPRSSYGFEDAQRDQNTQLNASDSLRRPERPESAPWPDSAASDSAGYAPGKGSRFAKFFDGKSREVPVLPKPQTPVGFMSNTSNAGQRQDNGLSNIPGLHSDHRTTDDLVAMLSSSVHVRGRFYNDNMILIFFFFSSDPLRSILPPWHPSLDIPSTRIRPTCNYFNNKLNKHIYLSIVAWNRYTKAVRITETSCRMAWFPVFALLLLLLLATIAKMDCSLTKTIQWSSTDSVHTIVDLSNRFILLMRPPFIPSKVDGPFQFSHITEAGLLPFRISSRL